MIIYWITALDRYCKSLILFAEREQYYIKKAWTSNMSKHLTRAIHDLSKHIERLRKLVAQEGRILREILTTTEELSGLVGALGARPADSSPCEKCRHREHCTEPCVALEAYLPARRKGEGGVKTGPSGILWIRKRIAEPTSEISMLGFVNMALTSRQNNLRQEHCVTSIVWP